MSLTKEEAKLIAQVLIAKTGEVFDMFAFDDCKELINDEEENQILSEIQKICTSTLKRLNKKYGLDLGSVNSTKEIIEEILYE